MKKVVIESPYAGNMQQVMENQYYAKRCLIDSLYRGEAPFASHLLYTLVLDDYDATERKKGMEAGFAWGLSADICAVYTDRGISNGMKEGIKRAEAAGLLIEYRKVKGYAE